MSNDIDILGAMLSPNEGTPALPASLDSGIVTVVVDASHVKVNLGDKEVTAFIPQSLGYTPIVNAAVQVLTQENSRTIMGVISGGTVQWALASHTHTVSQLSDATTIGRNILQDATAADVRTTIGAGTSNLVIGTTSTTAMAGNNTFSWTEITGKPTTFAPTAHDHDWADIINEPSLVTTGFLADRVVHGATYVDLLSPAGVPFRINDTGGMGSSVIYATEVSALSRDLFVHTSGILGYVASSRKKKTAERDYVAPLSALKTVKPKWFKYKKDVAEVGEEAATENVNFIAEDLYDAGLKEYLSYDGEGEGRDNVVTVHNTRITNALWSYCQQLLARIEALENEKQK